MKDSGIGIAPDNQERILERFVQMHDSLKKPHQRLGLGLTACCELLNLTDSKSQLP